MRPESRQQARKEAKEGSKGRAQREKDKRKRSKGSTKERKAREKAKGREMSSRVRSVYGWGAVKL